MNNKYTSEHIEFFRENTPGRTYKELAALFNERFGTDLPVSTVASASFRYGFKNGLDCKFNTGYEPTQFKKGHIPVNKGIKGGYMKANKTSFQKGNVPQNHRPVGSERINAGGYIEVKVSEPKRWRYKHVVLWEATNGPLPKGHAIIFADGNRLNICLDNLILVSRSDLLTINRYGLISNNADLTKTGIIMADIYKKIGQLKKDRKAKNGI